MTIGTHSISVEETQNLLAADSGVRLIDVRSAGEFTSVRIPGSRNIPLEVLRGKRNELDANHDDPVVLVCAAGPRAQQAREVLASHGWDQARVLDGGIKSWQSASAPVETSSGGTWDLERQVRFTAGSLVLLFVLLSLAFDPLKWGAAFIGAGLVFAAVSNFCGMALVLAKAPWNRRSPGATDQNVSALTQ